MLIVEGVRLQSVVPAHKNVLQLLAATWDGTSPMLIYPYSAQGNFKQYLTKFAAGGLSTHQVFKESTTITLPGIYKIYRD